MTVEQGDGPEVDEDAIRKYYYPELSIRRGVRAVRHVFSSMWAVVSNKPFDQDPAVQKVDEERELRERILYALYGEEGLLDEGSDEADANIEESDTEDSGVITSTRHLGHHGSGRTHSDYGDLVMSGHDVVGPPDIFSDRSFAGRRFSEEPADEDFHPGTGATMDEVLGSSSEADVDKSDVEEPGSGAETAEDDHETPWGGPMRFTSVDREAVLAHNRELRQARESERLAAMRLEAIRLKQERDAQRRAAETQASGDEQTAGSDSGPEEDQDEVVVDLDEHRSKRGRPA